MSNGVTMTGYTMRVFPKTPATRFALIIDLMSPIPVHDEEGNVVDLLPPILDREEGLRLLNAETE